MKIFIIGFHGSGKQEICDTLRNEGINVGRLFTNLPTSNNQSYHNYEVFSNEDIKEIFENNAYMFIKEIENESYEYFEGLSSYEFDNNDVFIITPNQFVKITPTTIKEPLCIIWLDNTQENRLLRYRQEKETYDFFKQELIEKQYVNDFISSIYNYPKSKLLYFTNEEPCRVATIAYTLVKHPELVDIYEKNFN